MKKLYSLILALSISAMIAGQSPLSFKYQAVLRNLRGDIKANTTSAIGIAILQGGTAGITVYSENHNVSTDNYGLINLEIGKGTPTFGTISGIEWGSGTYFIRITVDGIVMGTSQLLSVPYSLYAEKAGNGFSGSYNDLKNKPLLFNGSWSNLTGKPTTIAGFGITDAVTISGNQSIAGNKTFTGTVAGVNQTLSGKLGIAGNTFIGTSAPDPSAALDVSSTTQGFLPPRMSYAQKIAIPSPAAGLVIWCSDCGLSGELQVFNGTTWANLIGGTPSASLPLTGTTTAVTSITSTAASSGGNITNDGGAPITARGVCWSLTGNPSIADNKTNDGTGIGSFTSSLTGLTPATTYFVRTYATNDMGTSYGTPLSFTTLSSQSQVLSEQILTSGKSGYGNSISVSGNLAVIGAGWENTAQADKAGAVYIYEYINNQWTEKQRLTNTNGSFDKIFGQSVATNGTYIVITEPWARSAHIYSKSGSQWVLEKTITVTNVASEVFGISCDIYENTIVIGSGAVFAMYCSAVGSAYVYEKNGTDWTNTAILTASDGKPTDGFGDYVSIYQNTIAVGAGKTDCFAGSQGSVYIYEKNGVNWLETQKLNAPDGIFGDRFGGGVDIENNHLIVSSSGNGGLYYFQKGSTWEFKQKITTPSLAGNDNFGWPISLSNNKILIGAGSDSELYPNHGAVYVFEFDGTTWNKKLRIVPSDARANGGFGSVLFLNNNSVFVSGGAIKTDITNVYYYSIQ
jgi:predicted outer membrane repeat protein